MIMITQSYLSAVTRPVSWLVTSSVSRSLCRRQQFHTSKHCKMPLMHLCTNLQDKDIPKEFDLKLCEKVGEVLNKPIERITLTMHTGMRQVRAGSGKPMASLEIHSINVFDKEKNPTYTPPLLKFISESLKLPEDRVFLVYHDLLATNVGQVQP